ncbi:DUF2513 domain-containing protein [Aquitalea aquatica]|uniref:DUF2513 domain-containing protein n=1 Tax=Aquitalea aquatica TaxID=3044273 RepID=A0A838YES6_9NEIS|nr:DUF2513 domain-containing protein [Aquitalea magnusonii]MBA4709565.1 DUF2513 domain-containing protein [Aquitalea magnusonii]
MKRNMQTVFAILAACEKEFDGQPTLASVRTFVASYSGAGEVEQAYHLSLLEHGGFIRFDKQDLEMMRSNPFVLLTWAGHDLLDFLKARIAKGELI